MLSELLGAAILKERKEAAEVKVGSPDVAKQATPKK